MKVWLIIELLRSDPCGGRRPVKPTARELRRLVAPTRDVEYLRDLPNALDVG